MLNRMKEPTKGLWNGIGGKIELGETADHCIIREVQEETDIKITNRQLQYKGIITWQVDHVHYGGMYVFLVELDDHFVYPTPIKVDEGILDWKTITWLLSDRNFGVGEMIPHFLPVLLKSRSILEHKCSLVNNKLVDYQYTELNKQLG